MARVFTSWTEPQLPRIWRPHCTRLFIASLPITDAQEGNRMCVCVCVGGYLH